MIFYLWKLSNKILKNYTLSETIMTHPTTTGWKMGWPTPLQGSKLADPPPIFLQPTPLFTFWSAPYLKKIHYTYWWIRMVWMRVFNAYCGFAGRSEHASSELSVYYKLNPRLPKDRDWTTWLNIIEILISKAKYCWRRWLNSHLIWQSIVFLTLRYC